MHHCASALHVGFVDTDLTKGFDVPKSTPAAVARMTIDALETGLPEVLADEGARDLKQGLSRTEASYFNPPGKDVTSRHVRES